MSRPRKLRRLERMCFHWFLATGLELVEVDLDEQVRCIWFA